MKPGRVLSHVLLLLAALLTLLSVWVWWVNQDDLGQPDASTASPAAAPDPAQIARGAYLARAGNCQYCHSAPGGPDWAGGRAIETPFGTIYSSNLTPAVGSGLGDWNRTDFWRALHHGRARDGRLLYPAFPYPAYSALRRSDADDLFAFLRSLAPVEQSQLPATLGWPYNTQAALALWRALYFRPAQHTDDSRQTPAWNRGAYLVNTLGHCGSCHTPRNRLGAALPERALGGERLPLGQGYAPSLLDPTQAGLADWPEADITALLQTGISRRASSSGVMALVVLHSTQYLHPDDLRAMAEYLKKLPGAAPAADQRSSASPPDPAGIVLYQRYCADCHGAQGQGVPGAYPALAGNRALLLQDTTNLLQITLYGGFAPATQGNPRPFGMPPFVLQLSDADLARLLSALRQSWGNQAAPLSELDVRRARSRLGAAR